MRQKSGPAKAPAEAVLKDIRRATRRHFSAEDKIGIVLEGSRGEESIAELCRREGIATSMYYGWSKEFRFAALRVLKPAKSVWPATRPAPLAALRRNRAARNRHQAVRARHDMRAWQVERRERTRRLIELGGLVVKASIADLAGDDRAMIYGALLWMADKLQSDQGEHAQALWAKLGNQAFAAE